MELDVQLLNNEMNTQFKKTGYTRVKVFFSVLIAFRLSLHVSACVSLSC